MADALGPDPATRDLAAALILDHFPESSSKAIQVANKLSDAGLLVLVPPTPPLPAEPPPGVYGGIGHTIWQRLPNTDPDVWFKVGSGQIHTWADAHADGADPTRRLVELPDPNDYDAMCDLDAHSYRVAKVRGPDAPGPTVSAWVVRALTERGPA